MIHDMNTIEGDDGVKKRRAFIALVLALCLCLPACCAAESALRGYDTQTGYQYVSLGRFPQGANGEVYPILWRVLRVDEQEALLLSEYILFNNRVHPDDVAYIGFGGAFNQTEMFALLNGPFVGNPVSEEERVNLLAKWRVGRVHIATACFKDEAFTQDEQAMLTQDGELGTVFLLTSDDISNADYGFGSNKSRQAVGTPYALANGLFKYQNGSSPYWMRNPSVNYPYGTRCTKVDGKIGYIRCVVMNEGCRPAIRLRLDGLRATGGDGSMGNPWRFARGE